MRGRSQVCWPWCKLTSSMCGETEWDGHGKEVGGANTSSSCLQAGGTRAGGLGKNPGEPYSILTDKRRDFKRWQHSEDGLDCDAACWTPVGHPLWSPRLAVVCSREEERGRGWWSEELITHDDGYVILIHGSGGKPSSKLSLFLNAAATALAHCSLSKATR